MEQTTGHSNAVFPLSLIEKWGVSSCPVADQGVTVSAVLAQLTLWRNSIKKSYFRASVVYYSQYQPASCYHVDNFQYYYEPTNKTMSQGFPRRTDNYSTLRLQNFKELVFKFLEINAKNCNLNASNVQK